MSRARDISKIDEKTFRIVLNEPFGLLIEALWRPFMMREADANRPPTEQVTANIGSGPFRFNEALARPGSSFTYDRNDRYVPRKEPADGYAGGKIVKVDRAIWSNIGDQQTAIAALQAGEVDYIESPPVDLYPAIESDPNLALQVLNKSGQDLYLRMNCLQKPFNNLKARQALLHLVDQEAFMRAAIGNPNYTNSIRSWFGDDTPYTNDENTGWYKKGGDPEKARQLFKEAGYAGEKVVILQPTNITFLSNASQLLAAELRKIGVNAELAPSDWGGVVARRAKKSSVEDGGWSIFITADSDFSHSYPLFSVVMPANGENGWYGWPKNDEYETLRLTWADLETLEQRQALARKMQRAYWDNPGSILLGHYFSAIARRKTLTGLIGLIDWSPMWNMQKA